MLEEALQRKGWEAEKREEQAVALGLRTRPLCDTLKNFRVSQSEHRRANRRELIW